MQGNSIPKPRYLLTMARDRLGREALAIQVEALCDDARCKVWFDRTGRPVEGNIGQIFAAGMDELKPLAAESWHANVELCL